MIVWANKGKHKSTLSILSPALNSNLQSRLLLLLWGKNFNLQFISIYKFQIQFTVVPTSHGGTNLQFTIHINLFNFQIQFTVVPTFPPLRKQKAAEDPRWNKRLVQWWNYKLMTNSKSHLFLSHWGAQFHQLLWLLFSILQQRSVFNTNN